MRMPKVSLWCALLVGLTHASHATTWYVAIGGNDSSAGTNWATAKATIQAAIDLTLDGDTVLVSNGIYATGTRAVFSNMPNRVAITNAITVQSVNGAQATSIVGAGPSGSNGVRCVYVGSNAVLSGFTLTNGATRIAGAVFLEQSGGGVWCEDSGTVSNCLIMCNNASYYGGGTYGGILHNCIIMTNAARFGGGACGGVLNNCLLVRNSASSAGGGSIMATLNNCTITINQGNATAGGCATGTLNNCIVHYNVSNGASNYSGCVMNYCSSWPMPTSGVGNISGAPLFVSIGSNDYHLASGSAGIDAGNNAYAANMTTDLDGKPRINNGTVDMGAYEWNTNYATISVQVSPSGSGAAAGGGLYIVGSNAVISATPASIGWTFAYWNDAVTNMPRTIVVPSTNIIRYTAFFTQVISTVSLQANPPGGGVLSGGGLYQAGTNIVLSATPNAGWVFTGWNDGSTNMSRTIVVPVTNISYTANFIWNTNVAIVTLLAAPPAGGTVSGAGIYSIGSNITISATPNANWLFSGWSDSVTNMARTIVVPPTNTTFTATFTNMPLQLVGVPADTNVPCGQQIAAANVTATGGCVLAVPSPDTLALHYSFDSVVGSNVLDQSGNGLTGKIYGVCSVTTNGHAGTGSAMQFPNNGSSYIDVGTGTTCVITGAFSLAAWICPTSTLPSGDGGIVAYGADSSSVAYGMSLAGTGAIKFASSEHGSVTNELWTDNAAAPKGVWTHVVCTLDSANQAFVYINGSAYKVGTLSHPGALTGIRSLFVGRWRSGYDFSGLIDEVRIYKRALSSNEVQMLYTSREAFIGMSQTTNGLCPKVVARVWTATDICSNSISATQIVSFVDAQPPTLVGVPSNVTQYCGQPLPSIPTVTAIDNCSSATVQYAEVNAGTCPDTISRTWTAIDACGNSTIATQLIFVVPAPPLVLIGVPSNTTVNCGQPMPAVTIAVTGGCGFVAGAPTTNGMLLYYSFDSSNATAVADNSGNGYTGTVVGATWTGTGKNGGAYYFNGSSRIRVGNYFDLGGALTTLSVCVWEKMPTNSTSATQSFVNKLQETSPYTGWCLRSEAGQAQTEFEASWPQGAVALATNVNTRDGLWHHLCGQFEVGSNLLRTKIYADGILQAQVDTLGSHASTMTSAELWLGQRSPGGSNGMTGWLDEVRIYNRMLSSDEVYVLANGNAAPVTLVETTNGTCPKVVTRVWSASDSCGGSISATQLVTLVDTQPPTLVGVPSNVTQFCWQTLPSVPNVTAVDNCSSATVQMVEVNTGTCPGTVTRTWTAIDLCGNTTSRTQIITLLQQYVTVSAVTNPANGGTVAGSGLYAVGTNVVLTATPSPYWSFVSWSDGNSNSSRTIIVPTSNVTYTAKFARVMSFVSLQTNPSAGGVLSGGGYFQAGSNVVIAATPASRWVFSAWNDGITDSTRTITVPITNITYTASFVRPSPSLWYVSTNGDDSAAATSWASAKRTIQAAIDVCYPNDIIIVSNGTYDTGWRYAPGQPMPPLPTWPTRLVVSNTITVRSLNGPAQTIIDGSGSLRCVYLNNGATLDGFTLVNGLTVAGAFVADGRGAGVFGTSKSCIVSNCIISGNYAVHAGGGVYGCTLFDSTVENNMSDGSGGGAAGGVLNNCLIAGNYSGGGAGGGADGATLNNCTVVNNGALTDGGGARGCAINNSIVLFNLSDISSTNYNYFKCTNNYSCTMPLSPGVGNIAVDPLFRDTASGNYRLTEASPCIDTGSNMSVFDADDLDGNPRIMNGTVDIGAYESMTRSVVTVTANPVAGGSVAGGGLFFTGSNITISASPSDWWSFVSWNDGDTNLTRTVTAPASNITYVAGFVRQYATVNIATNPSEGGVVQGGGTFEAGSNVVLVAVRNAYWRFADWSDGDTNVSREIALSAADVTLTANFARITSALSVVADPLNGGAVVGGGSYEAGSTQQLAATAASGWIFSKWNDGSAVNPRAVIVPETNIEFTATFSQLSGLITLLANPSHGGVVAGGGSFPVGSDHVISASPHRGWGFIQWQEDHSTSSVRSVVVPTNGAIYTAVFTITSRVASTICDFDGDGVSDLAVFKTAGSNWYIRPSSAPDSMRTNFVRRMGYVPTPGDFDGDEIDDVAVFDAANGVWFIWPSSRTGSLWRQSWGVKSVVPVAGDYDGDGITDLATFKPSTGSWRIRPSSHTNTITSLTWGSSLTVPVPGDYDGDGTTDLATYRRSSGTWYVRQSSRTNELLYINTGWSNAVPVSGDFDGDGKTDVAAYYSASGYWYVRMSSDSNAVAVRWGGKSILPVPGDYDGDGISDVAAYNTTNGHWIVRLSSSTNAPWELKWGSNKNLPVDNQTRINRSFGIQK